jgi:hypothetical protein
MIGCSVIALHVIVLVVGCLPRAFRPRHGYIRLLMTKPCWREVLYDFSLAERILPTPRQVCPLRRTIQRSRRYRGG